MTNWQELEQKYYMQVIKRVPLTLVRGKGVCVWDDQGRVYLDFVGGLAVNCLGHSHPVVVQALSEQAGHLIQTCNQFYTIPQVRLAQLLVENSCLDRVFLCNSGTEANEGAVKLARRYGKLKLGGAYEVITTFNSFHGRTLAMVAATGQAKFQEPYTPMPAGFVNVAYDDIEAIKAATSERTCAVMLEPIQGEGGVIIPGEHYFKEVAAWCQKKGLLLILDEIQTGMGRTGSLFAYQQLGVEPDIMTLAKGLGSGVPIGAVLAKEKAAVFSLGDHGSTYGGNPLTCAVGYAVAKYIIDYDVPGNARQMGQRLLAGLEELRSKFDFVAEARGRGLLVALEFKRDMADKVLQDCLERGLLVNQPKPNVVRFIPPLIVTEAEVDEALAILEEALAAAGAEPVASPEK
jgi:predicted acetylornithine/succinylornithine family transaminase